MNVINLSIPGPEVTIMDATGKLQAFLARLSMWKTRVEADNLQTLKSWRKYFTKME
jgi:hypothetical protein